MRVLGVIPARGGSKGVPRKNIRQLGSKPLLAYTVEAARNSRIETTVVSTEDPEIAEVATRLGVDVVRRPAALATDESPTHPVVMHALSEVERGSERFDAVFTLQVTTPFRATDDIDEAIALLESSGADSVIGVVRVFDQHPVRMKRLVDGYLVPYCEPEPEGMRRQDLPPAFLRNGAVYLTRRSVLCAGSVMGKRQLAFEMPRDRSLNIDEPLDFALAEVLLEQQQTRT